MAIDVPELASPAEGLERMARSLPDDCIEYTISIIDTKLGGIAIRQRLREIQASSNTLTKKLLKGFIWQRDAFHLELVQEDGSYFLRGRTQYGDSVEDEWLIVYLLRQLSREHSHIWIRVTDTDGQFLLIEAANTLPKWLNPEISDFRVWINDGRLLIIPRDCQALKGGSGSQSLTLKDALSIIQKDTSQLIHSPLIQTEAFYRLEKYPEHIIKSLHHANVRIPRKLAYVIRQDESYISPATEAFYLRDPIALRPLQKSTTMNLVFPPQDLINVSVKFTRIGYAQLKSQQFSTPPVWVEILPRQNDAAALVSDEIGMKITCGFEMLMSDHQYQDRRHVREIKLLLEDLDKGQDELPSDSEIQKWPKKQDDEHWLDINFDSFEQELAGKRAGPSTGPGNGFGDSGAQKNLRKMVARFEDFLNDDAAGTDGVEDLDDMDMDDDTDDSDQSESEDQEISFDEQQFGAMMEEMMGVSIAEAGVAGSNHSSIWGRRIRASDGSSSDHTPSHLPNEILALSPSGQLRGSDLGQSRTSVDSDADTSSEEQAGIREAMNGMEKELRDAGALRLNADAPSEEVSSQGEITDGQPQRPEHKVGVTDSLGIDEEVNIDLNLAKNLLESFKGQAGLAGPGGNLLGLMGVRVPRDEDVDI